MTAYYNEIDAFAAQWLRNLIANGLIAAGDVDERSILNVQPDELRGYTQCHFFAGIGGWSHALRLAGWPDDRPIWTGSCPCQPFSVAGKGLGEADPRHLWPHFHRLIAAVRPPVVMGEQVAGAAGYGWLDGVRADLEGENYACRGVDIPACAVDAPHIRQRLYWVARNMDNTNDARLEGQPWDGFRGAGRAGEARPVTEASSGYMADSDSLRRPHERLDGVQRQPIHDADGCGECRDMADAERSRDGGRRVYRPRESSGPHRQREADQSVGARAGDGSSGSFWSNAIWLAGADGKARRAEPTIPLLAHGLPGRVGRLRAYGNAIVPPLAAEVIKAFMECEP